MSPICIFAGVPPRMWPDLQILQHLARNRRRNANDRRHSQHRRHAANARNSQRHHHSAATTNVHSVRPETGLFDEPIMPTRLPETAAKKNPRTIITAAATTAPAMILLRSDYARPQ